MSLERSVAGKWTEIKSIRKKRYPLILGWIYSCDEDVGVLVEYDDEFAILRTKFEDKKVLKKNIKIVVSL